MAANFEDAGAFKINDQWATAIKYKAKLDGERVKSVDLAFVNGRKQLVEVVNLSREDAIALIGEANLSSIEQELGADKKEKDADKSEAVAGEKTSSGKLQGELLTFREANTTDYEPNEVQMGIEQDKTMDDEVIDNVRGMVARRRQELLLQRQNNLAVDRSEEIPLELSHKSAERSDDGDRNKAIPASVAKRFIQVEEKFYFPDETLAFLDKGESLKARAEHKEVVKAIVAIAEARGWDKLTVRGSEAFRRAVFIEAAERGIEVKGYKPSEVERAKLEAALARSGGKESGERAVATENEVIKGFNREAEKSVDSTPRRAEDAEKIEGAPKRVHTGILVAHGKDHYNHDPQESVNYWVTIRREDGKEEKIWGKDLERNFAEGDFKAGEKIEVAYMGNQPVIVNAPVRDPETKEVVGHQEIETNRNTWRVTKAEAFRNQSRSEAVAQHPDLAPHYGTMAAAAAFAKEKLPSKESQARFVQATKEAVAKGIEEGKPVPAAKIVRAKRQSIEADREQQEKAKKPAEITR